MATRKPAARKPRKAVEAIPSNSLFTPAVESMPAKPPAWCLATNHLNLLYMLGSGLVTGPAGFGDKYYADALAAWPGWIPFFRTNVPSAVLSSAVADASHLKACVAEFDLASIRSHAFAITNDGQLREIEFPDGLAEEIDVVLLPAPMPIALVKRIAFASAEGHSAFEERAKDAGNVDLERIDLVVEEDRFSNDAQAAWPPAGGPQARDGLDDLVAAQSVGGVLAMLSNVANRSDLALAAYRLAFRQPVPGDHQSIARDSVLAELPAWLESGEIPPHAETPARLYWGVVDAILRARRENIPLCPIDQTLRFLEGELPKLPKEAFRPRLERLLKDMRGIASFGAGTITELFERHRGSFSRPLLVFCLRESADELLDFSHPLLGDVDLILSAILFGVRDGWAGLPNALRQPSPLAQHVGLRMVQVAFRHVPSRPSFNTPANRPVPLRELFEHKGKQWSDTQKQAALELARSAKWKECIHTRISLGKGDYRLSIDGGGIHLLLDGDVKAVTTLADMDKFMQMLGTHRIDRKTEQMIRARLNAE